MTEEDLKTIELLRSQLEEGAKLPTFGIVSALKTLTAEVRRLRGLVLAVGVAVGSELRYFDVDDAIADQVDEVTGESSKRVL